MKPTLLASDLRTALIVILVFVTGVVSAQQDIFDEIRPCFELSEFIARSEFVPDVKSANAAFVSAMKQQNIDLLPVNPAPGQSSLPAGATKATFSTSDGEILYDVITSSDGNYLFEQW